MMSNYSSRNPLAGVYSPKTIHTPLKTAASNVIQGHGAVEVATSSPVQAALIQQQQLQQAVVTDVVSATPVVNIPGEGI